jgi:hypothetical protein
LSPHPVIGLKPASGSPPCVPTAAINSSEAWEVELADVEPDSEPDAEPDSEPDAEPSSELRVELDTQPDIEVIIPIVAIIKIIDPINKYSWFFLI